MTSPVILVTGGAGYIGSHTALALKESGYDVVVFDNLSHGHRDLVEQVLNVPLIIGDIADNNLLQKTMTEYKINAVMHFAANAYVRESVHEPSKYYLNNVVNSLSLLEVMQSLSINKIVFSSTCATYGIPETIPIYETEVQSPITPYGRSKRMVEEIIKDYETAYGLKFIIFRYFNAAGADPACRLGEDHVPETHLIPLLLQVVAGKREYIEIYGDDYDTPDGTCIRDYIHVCDIAEAHVLGLKKLLQTEESNIYNLGNDRGFSIQEIIQATEKITACKIPIRIAKRHPGEPQKLVGSADKARKELGWLPRYKNIEQIIEHAYAWYKTRNLN